MIKNLAYAGLVPPFTPGRPMAGFVTGAATCPA